MASTSQLQSQINNLNSQITTLKNQIAALNKQIASLTTLNQSLTVQNSSLTSQASQLTSQLASANANITNLTAQNKTLVDDAAAAHAQVADLSNQVAALNVKIADLQNQLNPPVVPTPDPVVPSVELTLSGDAYLGNPQFEVYFDGALVKSGEVSAVHANKETQIVSINGDPKVIEVKFLNDNYGGDPTKDCNLYIVQIKTPSKTLVPSDGVYSTVIGTTNPTTDGSMLWAGTYKFTLSDPVVTPTTDPVTPPIVTPPIATKKRKVLNHLMACYSCGLAGFESATESIKRTGSIGQKGIWLHFDNPPVKSGNYADALDQFLAAAVGTDTTIIPGFHGNGSFTKEDYAGLFKKYLDHPSIFKNNGKPVVWIYDYRNERKTDIEYAKAQYGKPVEVWVYLEAVLVPEITDKTYTGLEGWLKTHTEVDGVGSFAVNWASSDGKYVDHADPKCVDLMIARNNNIVNVCKKLGKTSIPGFAIRYHSSYMSDAGILAVQDANLANPGDYWCLTTWNDLGESQIGDVGTDFDTNDTVWLPQRNAGYGTPVQYPRQTRYRQLIQPKIDQYLAL